jgi:hypothetical protein
VGCALLLGKLGWFLSHCDDDDDRESNEKQLEIGNGCGTDGRTIWLQSVQTNNGTNRMYNDDDDVVAAQSYN